MNKALSEVYLLAEFKIFVGNLLQCIICVNERFSGLISVMGHLNNDRETHNLSKTHRHKSTKMSLADIPQ